MAFADQLIPPREALPVYARETDYREVAEAQLETAVTRGLRPDHRVLDLGCGVGRFAVALAGYLDEHGSYEGVDASAESVDICRRWVGTSIERFHFHHAEVFNSHYNPSSDARALDYRFPFPDGSFDFQFSNSLFTHLLLEDTENYLTEIGRVLKPGATAVNTVLLLNPTSLRLLDAGESGQSLPHALYDGRVRVKRLDRPEAVIAYRESFIQELHDAADLEIVDVRYGAWSGRESSGPGYGAQDIVTAIRRP